MERSPKTVTPLPCPDAIGVGAVPATSPTRSRNWRPLSGRFSILSFVMSCDRLLLVTSTTFVLPVTTTVSATDCTCNCTSTVVASFRPTRTSGSVCVVNPAMVTVSVYVPAGMPTS